MRITLSTLVLPAVIARHVQLPLLDEVNGRRAQHVDGSRDDFLLVSTVESATSKLSGAWFDEGPKTSEKQSKW